MLVKFTSSTSGQIMMFAPVARQLLEVVGKDCSARGVITTEQLPEAITRLRRAAAEQPGAPAAADGNPDHPRTKSDDDEAPTVGLGQRAYPLIEILQWTQQEEGFVLWEAEKDF
ncbi:MAG TPA: DUF1840 domain-containing protein [Candidatus Accumulibacter phosphatis]|nr:MAG: hypothetical protein AW07_01508 [Candidatus Accumulibacter sp. SK-11]HAY26020.1 DUF1840 domain-containing protein [Accumulibacter sp.]HRL76171.1 DUF1840 domain-containing protein [Candidatus Accumulibacter phosphatis]HCN68229.1 DUF1840 domain-containing protein [Accumulibacter sp.]HCV12976.1 DUF1840 domain-containing protein [Accumulibacter sp.]